VADYLTGHWRLAIGTLTEAELTAAYNVIDFPRQSDQRQRWFVPNDVPNPFVLDAEVIDGLNHARGGFGGMAFSWTFTALTPLMVDYLWTTLFEEQYSQTFTVMTWARRGGWKVVNCTGKWNEPGTSAESPDGWPGFDKLRIDFVAGEGGGIAPSGFGVLLETGDLLVTESGDILDLE
jgi:hypothetical protein